MILFALAYLAVLMIGGSMLTAHLGRDFETPRQHLVLAGQFVAGAVALTAAICGALALIDAMPNLLLGLLAVFVIGGVTVGLPAAACFMGRASAEMEDLLIDLEIEIRRLEIRRAIEEHEAARH
jgi:hypothetical protein